MFAGLLKYDQYVRLTHDRRMQLTGTQVGATISAPGIPTDVLLLPGQYTSDSSPQLLHSVLTSSAASLSPSPGFNASLKTLPLNLALGPGLAIFSDTLYSGQSGFSALPTNLIVNSSSPLAAKSLSLSSNIWITTTNGSPDERVILWDSVPDINELPLGLHPISLSLVDIQLNACSPPCAASGICSASGTCKCAPGFTGSSCETCETGFFGPKCQPCPANCTTCDDGITGSGRCLQPIVANAPSTCNCLNGVCGTNGSCTCNTGFTKSDNGTACAKCSPGFFSTSTEDCKGILNGACVSADSNGICSGTNMIADNNKVECDGASGHYSFSHAILLAELVRDLRHFVLHAPQTNWLLMENVSQLAPPAPSPHLAHLTDVAFQPAVDHNTLILPPRPVNRAILAAQAAQALAPAAAWHVQVLIKSSAAEPASQPIANKTRLSFPASPSGTSAAAPLPTITGINTPTPPLTKRSLEWWQILLMALGCAFILLVFIWCCRRRARKQRTKKTAMFASQPGYGRMAKSSWRWRLIRFGEKLFGHKRSRKADLVIRHHTLQEETEAVKLRKIRMAEEARVDSEQDLVQLIGDYNYPDPKESSLGQQHYYQGHEHDDDRLLPVDRRSISQASQLSAPSIYSQMTGVPNRTPQPRQPLRKKDLTSRFSTSTLSSSDEVRLRTSSDRTKNPFRK
ncbi:hypothetical protein C0989_000358 [Termitomyces sp. Mn162]|nr:hypothetical protein C0989_000358 [Termitomyces sp. Mn162]